MEFQIDVSADTRTPEQNALLERYYQAARILRAAGFRAKTSLLFCNRPKDQPACIDLDEI
ncbi:hypothetical protein LCGC14_2652050 [marine sediment metagenome]|uniref:Uncharacterized protein n=1 Tax=marine sediment metagenome TaxID=412755 RepID=A0A0F8ZUK5_9ZZZZ